LAAITHSQRRETSMHTKPGYQSTIPSTGTFEVQAGRILEFLPGAKLVRTQDAIEIAYGGEEGIVVIVTQKVLN
jgi:hypothetical protein